MFVLPYLWVKIKRIKKTYFRQGGKYRSVEPLREVLGRRQIE